MNTLTKMAICTWPTLRMRCLDERDTLRNLYFYITLLSSHDLIIISPCLTVVRTCRWVLSLSLSVCACCSIYWHQFVMNHERGNRLVTIYITSISSLLCILQFVLYIPCISSYALLSSTVYCRFHNTSMYHMNRWQFFNSLFTVCVTYMIPSPYEPYFISCDIISIVITILTWLYLLLLLHG